MRACFVAFLGALLSTWVAYPVDAQAQTLCGKRNDVVAALERGYSEKPVSVGLASNGAVVEVYASAKGTFTILMTQANGLSCLVAAGDNWESLPLKRADAKT